MLEQLLVEPPINPIAELIDGFVKGRISIVLPAYDEAQNIARTILEVKKQFEALSRDYEIIVVDDGSHDRTWTIVEEMEEEGKVRIVRHSRNHGKGHALKSGLYQATGEFAFMIDSDMEIWSKELPSYLKALQSADVVIGSKRHPLSTVRTPVMRKFLSLGFNLLERVLTGVQATDTQAGLKAARSSTLYTILPILAVKRYAFDAELLAVATLLNFRIRELPVDIDLKATFSPRHVVRMLLDLLGITYRLRVRQWYQKNFIVMTHTYQPLISLNRIRNRSS